MTEFVFWQCSLSPHSVPLAVALQKRGHSVRVNILGDLSEERRALGWQSPECDELDVVTLDASTSASELSKQINSDAIHLLQGLPRSGILRLVHCCLAKRKVPFGSMMEQVDDSGPKGVIKRFEYAIRLRGRKAPQFVLAIGEKASPWFKKRSKGDLMVFPFAYFLDEKEPPKSLQRSAKFSVGFVGRMDNGKGLDLLIVALSKLTKGQSIRMICVGDGPERQRLGQLADRRLEGEKVRWLGVLPREQAREHIGNLDILVLPSRYDGWGAVISEALLQGVPVICSDACGAVVAVRRAPYSGVFENGNVDQLSRELSKAISRGALRPSERVRLSNWARCLNAAAGAIYLEQIVESLGNPFGPLPKPPWQ